jgi:hypothetical protein
LVNSSLVSETRDLKVAIALAFGNPDLKEMPKTHAALEALYEKIERIYHHTTTEANKEE